MSNTFPVSHPHYRYPVSKNPYAQKLRTEGLSVFVDEETEQSAGHWRERLNLPSSAPLILEVGCNTGHVLRARAEKNLNKHYLGMDYKFKMLHQGALKAFRKNLRNVTFLRMNAERIFYAFAEGELSEIQVYFPDPWPTPSTWKHRWLRPDTVASLAYVLQAGGLLEIKTDHPGYFEWIERSLGEWPGYFELVSRSEDLHVGNLQAEQLEIPEVTLFEKIYIREKIPIHRLELKRTDKKFEKIPELGSPAKEIVKEASLKWDLKKI